MKASDLFVAALENEGIHYVFGVPGEENLDLLESLRVSKIRFVPTRHEQAAGFMAATVGRLTGKPGVALSTLGPGATNLMTPAAYAQLGAMPMLMVTGQKPIKKSKQGAFQIIDAVDMMRPVTKFTRQIVNGNSVPSLVREACRLAEEERPGAVHLELPEDVAAEPSEGELFDAHRVRRPVAEEKAIAHAVELIQAAKRPILLVGSGANRKLTSNMLRAFVDALGIPFVDTQMGKGVMDERHPLWIGTTALSAGDWVHCALARADLIINVGHDVVEKPPFLMKRDGPKVMHVHFYAAKVDPVYFPHHEVIGDIGNAIWQLKERVKPQAHWDFHYFLKAKHTLAAHIARGETADHVPLFPQRVVADVRASLPQDGIACLDNGMYKLWFARQYQVSEPNTILLDNALATMGAGLPSAIAAKLVYPERTVVAVCGDGGFLMNGQELETAVRLKLDLVILVLRDGGYGMIKWKQEAAGMASFGLDFGNPDFVALAAAYGASGHRVEKTGDLVRLMDQARVAGGVHLIEVPIDYSENDRVFTKELKQLSCEF